MPGQARSKVMPAAEAVKRFIRPQQAILIGERGLPLGGPYALQFEIIRQFHNKYPEFTLVLYGGGAVNLAPWLHCGMARKVISCFMGDAYPSPSPNPVIQQAYAAGEVEFEEWTMLTLALRLLAGAMGLPFFPVNSITGSSLAEQNRHFTVMPDPFGGEDTGVVRSLRPDISLVHAWLADEEGNAVILPPYGGNAYGALAAREGVILSAERVVPAEELLRYREHIRIPGSYVKAVVELPFGSHPSGHPSFPLPDGGYREDEAFILQTRQACRSTDSMKAWLETWILGCRDHQDYLHKLGRGRLAALQGERTPSAAAAPPPEPTAEEMMIVAAARQIRKKVRENNYRSIFTGIGAAHMACWLAYYLLQNEGRSVSLLVDSGLNGYIPLPGDPYLFAFQNIGSGGMYNDILHTMGIFVQGPQAHCLTVMGAAQIDGYGNINSSKLRQGNTYLMGAGGGNDAVSGAAEVIAVVSLGIHRFREQIDYVTSPGHRVTTIVTQYGVFEKDGNGRFRLSACIEHPAAGIAEITEMIRSQCGWEFITADKPDVIPRPAADELALLRQLDPERLFLEK